MQKDDKLCPPTPSTQIHTGSEDLVTASSIILVGWRGRCEEWVVMQVIKRRCTSHSPPPFQAFGYSVQELAKWSVDYPCAWFVWGKMWLIRFTSLEWIGSEDVVLVKELSSSCCSTWAFLLSWENKFQLKTGGKKFAFKVLFTSKYKWCAVHSNIRMYTFYKLASPKLFGIDALKKLKVIIMHVKCV